TGPERRALIERQSEQRAGEENEETGTGRPEVRRQRREEGHDPERRTGVPKHGHEGGPVGETLGHRDGARDEPGVDEDEDEPAGERVGAHPDDVVMDRAGQLDGAGAGCRDRVGAAVERCPHQRAALVQHGQEDAERGDRGRRLPAEDDEDGDEEDEGQRDLASLVVERNRVEIGDEREPEEEADPEPLVQMGRRRDDACSRDPEDAGGEDHHGRDESDEAWRKAPVCLIVRVHRPRGSRGSRSRTGPAAETLLEQIAQRREELAPAETGAGGDEQGCQSTERNRGLDGRREPTNHCRVTSKWWTAAVLRTAYSLRGRDRSSPQKGDQGTPAVGSLEWGT